MAMYALQEATLGEVEGEGYAFRRRTVNGPQYQGVFFANEEDQETLEAMQDEDATVHFSGVAYRKLKSGKVRQEQQDFVVDVTSFRSVPAGERAFFQVLEEADLDDTD